MVIEPAGLPTLREDADAVPSAQASPQFLEALGVAVYTTDAHGVITAYNEAAVDLWGRRPVIGQDMWCGSWKLYRTDGTPLSHDQCPMGVALREDRAVRGEEAIAERPDGTRVWFQPFPTPLHDADGRVIGAVNVLVDVTARKRGEDAASYLAAIVESSDDAIVSKDLNGTIASWNKGAERLFGYAAAEACGKSIRLIIPPDRQHEEDEVIARVRKGDRVDHFETIRRRKDGAEIPVSVSISPVKDASGRVIGASKIARDISQQKQAEAAVAEALAVKDEFIGLVSHELRTPVTMIVGNASLLARRHAALDAETRAGAIEDIRNESERLDGIIENLLALARSDGSDGETEPIVMRRLVERLVRERLELQGRAIDVRLDADDDAIVAGDEISLTHVLSNYLSNAEKYSPPRAPIEVIVDRHDDCVRVRVLDRGIGIDPQEADRLFESFYRSRNVGKVGGMGVGLSVCKRLMNAMGGECWAAPREGGGSEFGFSLPVYED